MEEVRAKACPDCRTLNALAARTCTTCGHEWPRDEGPRHDAHADGVRPILSGGVPPWLSVEGWHLARHVKPGAPDSLRVELHCGLQTHRVWVCLEHNGYARRKAEKWWRRMGGGTPPASVGEALTRQNELACPVAAQVRPAGKYHEIVGYRFADNASSLPMAAE